MSIRPFKQCTVAYGDDEAQKGELYLPSGDRAATLCLFHGGFWKMPYGRDQLDGASRALAGCGFVVWNLGYRRVGAPGGGYPGTLQDVDAGLNHLEVLAKEGCDIDLSRIVTVGHSAGGHLALWAAGRAGSRAPGIAPRVLPVMAVGLAPVADLRSGYTSDLGGGAVRGFMGGPPCDKPDAYDAASPIELLPTGVQQLVIHGLKDEIIPYQNSRTYGRLALRYTDRVDLHLLPDVGHMEPIDPSSGAFKIWSDILLRQFSA